METVDVVAEVMPVEDAVIVYVPLDIILKPLKVICPFVVTPETVPENMPEELKVNDIV